MKIIFIGCQGSGKSTQAEILAKKLNLPILSTGALFRQLSRQDSALAKRVQAIMTRGDLVDDATVLEIVQKFLSAEGRNGFITEGFPRNLNQVQHFVQDIDNVFYVKLSQDEALRRLTSRWSCPKCKANFNILTVPPKVVGICDFCGTTLVQRADDQKEAVAKRLSLYFAQTQPVLDYYRQKGIAHEIDGAKSIESIHKDILKILGL